MTGMTSDCAENMGRSLPINSLKKMEELKKSLEKTLRSYTDIQGKIQQRLRKSKIKVSINVWPMERNVENGFKEVSEELLSLFKKLSEEKKDIQQSYWKLKEDYKEKHQHLSSIQLVGKNRKVKMIEIILRELEPEEKGLEPMKQYIRECATDVKER